MLAAAGGESPIVAVDEWEGAAAAFVAFVGVAIAAVAFVAPAGLVAAVARTPI